MSTYCSNSEVQLDTGRSITTLLDEDLTSSEQQNIIRTARERAYNRINSKIRGKTAIPANHIPVLKQVEIDYVLSDLITSAYTLETVNQSDWAERYKTRADEVLDELHFDASAELPVAYRGNTGNGRLTITDVFSEHAKSEIWTFRASNATEFSVVGTLSGQFPDLTVDISYPEKDWPGGTIQDYGLTISSYPSIGNTPFICRVAAGSIDFVEGDVFTVKMFESETHRTGISTGMVIRA